MTSSNPSELSEQRHRALTELAARSREATHRARLDHAAADVIVALGQAGVEALLLKGAAVAQLLYAPDRERGYYDIDLLASAETRDVVERVLSELGYENVTRVQGIDDVAGAVHADLWRGLDGVGSVSIDLHWRLAGCKACEQSVWRSLRLGAQLISLDGRPALTLSPAGLALHSALHVAQHGPSDAKAVSDLRLGLSRWPADTWHAAAELARELDGFESFSAGIRLLPGGHPMALELDLDSGDRVLWDLAHRGSRPRGTFHLEAFARATTTRERFGLIRRALFPNPRWIRWDMRWAARSRVHLVGGYLRHVARAPSWAARAVRFSRQRPR